MAQRSTSDQYLQKIGNTYYARVRVPRTLEAHLGTHVRKSLKTTSRTEANIRKHAVVGTIKAELAQYRKAPDGIPKHAFSFEQARMIRDQLLSAKEGENEIEELAVVDAAVEQAETIERLYGPERAHRWYRAATTTTDTLNDLMDSWLSASDYKASTNAGHRKALGEVLSFLKNDHAVPSDVTRKVAIKYIDSDLTQRGLSYNTMRDRLVSLGGSGSGCSPKMPSRRVSIRGQDTGFPSRPTRVEARQRGRTPTTSFCACCKGMTA
jgi:hypothetical protein